MNTLQIWADVDAGILTPSEGQELLQTLIDSERRVAPPRQNYRVISRSETCRTGEILHTCEDLGHQCHETAWDAMECLEHCINDLGWKNASYWPVMPHNGNKNGRTRIAKAEG